MKKVIIFDLDGTLLDTLDDLTKAVNFALSNFEYPLRSREQVRKAIGNGVAKLIERSIPDGLLNENYAKCLEIFKCSYRDNYNERTRPYEGMKNTIIKLLNVGYKVTVATNKVIDVARILLDYHFPGLFDYIQGDVESVKKKPDPDMINRIVEHYRVSKDEVLYIGDTNVDEEVALNSQVDYVLVTYGYRTLEEIKNSCQTTNLINHPNEIFDYIKKLN